MPTEDPKEYDPKVMRLLQRMDFPHLDRDIPISNIIDNFWHTRYVTVSELAAQTKMLLYETNNAVESNESERHSDNEDDANENNLGDEILAKKAFCQDLERRGLLRLLSSGEPKKIGFSFDWYRHSLSC